MAPIPPIAEWSTASPAVRVVCSLGRDPDFVTWLMERVASDRSFRRRVEFCIPLSATEKDELLPHADVYVTYRFSEEEFRRTGCLRWLHMGVAGVDSAIFPALQKSRMILTSSVGIHDETVPMAAWAFVLAFATGLHEGYRQKFEGHWDRAAITAKRIPLSRQRILIVGTGRIGSGIARLAKQAGMDVWGMRRTSSRVSPPHFDHVITRRGFLNALGESDYVVLAVPGGPATQCLIGKDELIGMKPTAFLINVARGSVVDEPALIAALKSGTIAGAGLDVFAQEPLPAGHPFYTMPNVAFTPHTSGDTPDYPYRAAELFLKNLRRFLLGRPLLNVVDKRLGY